MDDKIKNFFLNIDNDINIYKWIKIKKYFKNLYEKIIESVKDNEVELFVNYYYDFLLFYYLYISYLFYLNLDIPEKLLNIDNQIKTDIDIIDFLIENKENKNIKFIILFIYPYYSFNKTKMKNKKIMFYLKYYENILNKEYENEYYKILELVVFKNMNSIDNEYLNYHAFYKKKILNNKINTNFNKFIKILPKKTNIFNFTINNENKNYNYNFNLQNILIYVTKYFYPNLTNENKIKKTKNKYTLIIDDNTIDIIINENRNHSVSLLKYNLKNLYENIHLTNEFLKETKNHIIIYFNTENINNFNLLLNFIHLIVTSFKILNNKILNIVDLNNRTSLTNYYYNSFFIFINYLKLKIKKKNIYENYLLELAKYYYIYSIYDYYFYYDNTLINELMHNKKNELNIFLDYCNKIKLNNQININTYYNYPPFHDNSTDDIDQPLYYSYQQPNYFKLFDFINSINDVYKNTDEIDLFDDVFLKLFTIEKIPNNINEDINIDKNKNNVFYTELEEDNNHRLFV
jgi:hypothetical protein